MLHGLKLYNLPSGYPFNIDLNEKGDQRKTGPEWQGLVFTLSTCQRTLVLGYNQWPLRAIKSESIEQAEVFEREEAYRFLLETICGLKSKIIGENEIVHQFKEAYISFLASGKPNTHLQSLLEKLLKDAKKVRTEHLRHIGGKSYAGIVRKLLLEKAQSKNITILGSGNMAEDVIKLCHRKFNISVWARNEKRCNELKSLYKVEVLNYENYQNEILKRPVIINTIGTNDPLFGEDPLKAIHCEQVIVDLSNTSPILRPSEEVVLGDNIFNLHRILDLGVILGKQKEDKIAAAKLAIKERTHHRQRSFSFKTPFGWEELQFA